ncbi:hypothetical protein WR25_00008 isoform A [Diploscapter pachys]|uniref:RRM domain-containing protein n=1 Tax=Diploscapter pachys TaxID=2018661 RepID=A0A2A2KE15_9BILA|nr:hypothetical protein WR25_00008 isoform A [Diploscapter pachys]
MAGDKKRKRTGVMEAKEAEKVKEVEKPKAESKEEKQESRPKRTKQKVERYFDKKEKTQETGTSIQSTGPPNSKSEKKKNKRRARPIYVLKISSIPYGFFEKQLLKYFLQFGQVIRVRVSRNKKTGNHRGWAYVGFDDKTVAEIAAETMDGYLMFNKRLSCRVMDAPPLCMKSGPRLVSVPSKRGTTIKDAKKRLKQQTEQNETKAQKRRSKSLEAAQLRLKAAGIEYDLPVPPSSKEKPQK